MAKLYREINGQGNPVSDGLPRVQTTRSQAIRFIFCIKKRSYHELPECEMMVNTPIEDKQGYHEGFKIKQGLFVKSRKITTLPTILESHIWLVESKWVGSERIQKWPLAGFLRQYVRTENFKLEKLGIPLGSTAPNNRWLIWCESGFRSNHNTNQLHPLSTGSSCQKHSAAKPKQALNAAGFELR